VSLDKPMTFGRRRFSRARWMTLECQFRVCVVVGRNGVSAVGVVRVDAQALGPERVDGGLSGCFRRPVHR
jgi:hypothetical protein